MEKQGIDHEVQVREVFDTWTDRKTPEGEGYLSRVERAAGGDARELLSGVYRQQAVEAIKQASGCQKEVSGSGGPTAELRKPPKIMTMS